MHPPQTRLALITALLRGGADPDIRCHSGTSPLLMTYARSFPYWDGQESVPGDPAACDILRLLLGHGICSRDSNPREPSLSLHREGSK